MAARGIEGFRLIATLEEWKKPQPQPARPETPSEQLVRDIRRMTRKQSGGEEHIHILRDGLRGECSITYLCTERVIGWHCRSCAGRTG